MGTILPPLHECNLFKMDFLETNETMIYLAIFRHKSRPTYESGGTGDNTWRIIPE